MLARAGQPRAVADAGQLKVRLRRRLAVATAEQCEQALHTLAGRMASSDNAKRRAGFDRSLACTLRDLGLSFGGALKDGELIDIRPVETPAADIRLELTSDDLVALVDGHLHLAAAWATGRIKVHASVRDLLRLRTMF